MTQMADTDSSTDLSGKVQDATEGAKQALQDVAGQAQDTFKTQLDQRSTAAGETATSVAQAVRNAGGDLRNQGQDLPARIIEQAADRVEQLGSYLRDSSADTILRDVEDFGRKQPWAVILGGIVVGFAASRFLKASSSRRYQAGRPASTGDWAQRSVMQPVPPPATEPVISPTSGAPYPPATAPVAPPVAFPDEPAPLQRVGDL